MPESTPIGLVAKDAAHREWRNVGAGNPLRDALIDAVKSVAVEPDLLRAIWKYLQAGELQATHPHTGRRFDRRIDTGDDIDPLWCLDFRNRKKCLRLLGQVEPLALPEVGSVPDWHITDSQPRKASEPPPVKVVARAPDWQMTEAKPREPIPYVADALESASHRGGGDALPTDLHEKRDELLRRFRELGGKRRSEGTGKRGALAALARSTGINDKNLGIHLDEAIARERRFAPFRGLGAKP